MAVIRRNFLTGNTSVLLSAGGTTLTSADLAALPVVAAPDYAWLSLDPLEEHGLPEIVKVTAHSSGAVSATIVRGQQTVEGGGPAREHPSGSFWSHPTTALDLNDAETALAAEAAARATGAENIRDYAATDAQRLVLGNGASKPLSGFYASLALAQADYPHAVALADELDWAVIQAAILAVQTAGEGAVFVPLGTYFVNRTLTYTGTPSKTFTFHGLGHGGQGPSGTVLFWNGSAGGTTMRLAGAFNTPIRGVAFSAGANKPLFHLDVIYGPGSSSYGTIEECHFGGCAGTNSAFVRLGQDGFDVSSWALVSCTASGDGTDAPTFGVLTNSNNSKNFSVLRSKIGGCSYGIAHGLIGDSSQGFLVVEETFFGYNTVADIKAAANGVVTVVGGGSEGSTRFVVGSAEVSHGSVTATGCYWAGACPADDYFIDYTGAVTLIGGSYVNSRTGSSMPKVRGGGLAGTSSSAVVSLGNFYKNAGRFAPIYDGSNNFWVDRVNEGVPLHVMSFGDLGGVGGTLTQLQSVWADAMYIPALYLAPNSGFKMMFDTDGAGTLVEAFRLYRDASYGANETAMSLRVRKGAAYSTDRVTIGAVDSGGVGFKVLRVPN